MDGGDDGDKEGNDDDDGGNDDDGVIDGGDDGGVVGLRDGMVDGTRLNEGLEDGDAEEEGDALSCTVTVFVTTSAAAVLSDESDTPSAIESTIKTTQTTANRILAFLCFNNGSCGSRGIAITTSFDTGIAFGITGVES